MPSGAVGVLLLSLTLSVGWARLSAWDRSSELRVFFPWVLLAAVSYWIAGAPLATEFWCVGWESQYPRFDSRAEPPLDLLVVLGGGAYSDAEGHVWLGPFGDRITAAARLFHQGKIDRIVATGKLHGWSGSQSVDPADGARRIWQELGIPAARILTVRGRNTTEEMRQLRQLVDRLGANRVGLMTSAFHLPRACRLARQEGIRVIPIPADRLSGISDPLPLSLIPSGASFYRTDVFAKEQLAALLGR